MPLCNRRSLRLFYNRQIRPHIIRGLPPPPSEHHPHQRPHEVEEQHHDRHRVYHSRDDANDHSRNCIDGECLEEGDEQACAYEAGDGEVDGESVGAAGGVGPKKDERYEDDGFNGDEEADLHSAVVLPEANDEGTGDHGEEVDDKEEPAGCSVGGMKGCVGDEGFRGGVEPCGSYSGLAEKEERGKENSDGYA